MFSGSAVENAGDWVFTPATGYIGTDYFQITVSGSYDLLQGVSGNDLLEDNGEESTAFIAAMAA